MPKRTRRSQPTNEELKTWGADKQIDFDETEKLTSSRIATFTIAVYVFGQAIGVWVVITRQNSLSLSAKKGDYQLSVLFTALTILTDSVYYSMINGDPGRLLREDQMSLEINSEVASLMNNAEQHLSDDLRDAQNCKYCRTTRLLRAKHCHQCGCCVARFDHHCYWIYNCVGAKNHCRFFILLILLSINLGWGNYLVWESFVAPPPNSSQTEVNINSARNFVPFIASVLGMPMWFFIMLVFSCHVFLIFSSVTTWEFVKRSKIPYLKSLPDDVNPWDKGYWGNLVSFCFSRRMDWRLPAQYFHSPV